MDVARDFPNCSAVAVDLVPMQSLYAALISWVGLMLMSFLDQCHRIAGEKMSRLMLVVNELIVGCDRSEVDDINLGLEHFYGDFNVVHARLVSSGVSSFQVFSG